MKDIIKQIVWKIYLELFLMYGRRLIKCQVRHMGAVFFKAYVKTFLLFPENKLKYNSDIASSVRSRLFEMPVAEGASPVDDNQVNSLYDTIKSEEWIKKTLSNYYLLEAFYYSYGTSSDLLKEKADHALAKAKVYVDSALPISYDDVGRIKKTIKSDIKLLKKEMRKLNSERVETEKLKLIEPVVISSSHVIFLASLFSTLFLISGFAYNKIFFSHFGINVGDFFGVSDYMASSVDILTATIISSILGVAFFFWGLSIAVSEDLHAEQFETERKGEDYVIPVIVISSAIALVVYSYQTGELHSLFLYPLIFFVALHVFFRLPIWKYIENKAAVGAILISILYFSLHLGFEIKENIEDIESGDYDSPYVIDFKKEYEKYSNHTFVSSNSNYLFLWNSDDNKIIIIPKSGVDSFVVK